MKISNVIKSIKLAKIMKALVLAVLSVLLLYVILIFEIKDWPAGSSIAGIIIGLSLPELFKAIQDLFDTTNWKVSQRKLKRGGFIKDDTMIRISFAYLYRIKVGNKYFLIKNERGTEKYQPVGGVYKLLGNEKSILRNKYQIVDDNKIVIDKSSRDDYRLRVENKYLRAFIRRFNRQAERERIDNLSREFREELIEKNIVNWNQIRYRVCGRHMTTLHWGEHFQCYELLLADVVELVPTTEQEMDLERLKKRKSDKYYFATAEEIMSLGINTESGDLRETIADHTTKILQENERDLIKDFDYGRCYTVNL